VSKAHPRNSQECTVLKRKISTSESSGGGGVSRLCSEKKHPLTFSLYLRLKCLDLNAKFCGYVYEELGSLRT